MYKNKVEFFTRFTLALVMVISSTIYLADQRAQALEVKQRNAKWFTIEHKAVSMKPTQRSVIKKITAKRISVLSNADKLSDKELVEVLRYAGFKGNSLKIAWAISKAESNGRPLAHNGNRKTGDNSYGIFQINMIDSTGVSRRDKFDLDSNSALFNPIRNARIAYHMSNGGKNWKAWSVYRSGAYKLRLKDFPKGV